MFPSYCGRDTHFSTTPRRSPVAVPDGMPILKSGSHRDPREGACVMEYISVLCGEPFTMVPTAVDPYVASWCWSINDIRPSDPLRADLLFPLVPRLLTTHRIHRRHGSWLRAQYQAAVATGYELPPNRREGGPAALARHLAEQLVRALDALERDPELAVLPDDPEPALLDDHAAYLEEALARLAEIRARIQLRASYRVADGPAASTQAADVPHWPDAPGALVYSGV